MTTHTYQTPAPLAAYLRRATYGLSAEQREEVWNELEEHVLCRANRLEFQGLDADQALRQAIKELGPPLKISLQLNGVHNMPKLFAFGTLIALGASASLYAAAQITPPTVQLPVQTKAPHTKCVKTDAPQPALTLYAKYDGYNCYQDDSKQVDMLTISYETLQQASNAVGFKTQLSQDGNMVTLYPPLSTKGIPIYTRYKENGIGYVNMSVLFQIATSPVPFSIHFEDYNKPTGIFAKHRIQLSSGEEGVGQLVYQGLTDAAIMRIYFSNSKTFYANSEPTDKGTPTRTVQTPFKAGEVIAAIQRVPSITKENNGEKYEVSQFRTSLGVTDAEGKVTLQMPADAKVVSTPQNEPNNDVLLLKLTNTRLGDMKSGILQAK